MAKLNGWPKGMDNVHQDNEIPDDTLRNAVNIDVLDSGKIRQRQGHDLALSVTNGHSFWSDKDIALFVENNYLKKFNPDGTSTIIGAVETGLNHLAYQSINTEIYYSSKVAKGKLVDGVMKQWGVEVPTSPPELSVSTGILEAGTYFAVVTYVADDGRESGASTQISITLDEVGGIAVVGMPIPTDETINRKRLYLTTNNGEVFFLAKEVGAMDQFVNINTPQLGHECRTLHLSPPPLSTCQTFANGRIFMIDANDNTIVWYTNALSYDLVDRRKGYYHYPKGANLIAGTKDGNGLYVCSDMTYYIGNPGVADQDTESIVFGFGAIAESLSIIPTTQEPIWMTERGAVIGKSGGAAQVLAADQLIPGAMDSAASMVRESNSLRQYVVVGQKNLEGSELQAGSYAEAEIVRRSDL